jgi:hypothetical protein
MLDLYSDNHSQRFAENLLSHSNLLTEKALLDSEMKSFEESQKKSFESSHENAEISKKRSNVESLIVKNLAQKTTITDEYNSKYSLKLSEVSKTYPNLQAVGLDASNLEPVLSQILSSYESNIDLNLNGNQLGTDSGNILLEFFRLHSNKIRTISCRNCDLSTDQVVSFAQHSFLETANYTSFDLRNNHRVDKTVVRTALDSLKTFSQKSNDCQKLFRF